MTESTILCDNLKHCCLKTLPSSIFNPAKRPVCPSVSRLLTQTNLCEASEFVKLELEKKSFHLPVGNRVLLLCRANSIQRCHSPLRNSVCLSLNYHDWTIWRKYGWQYLAIFGNLLQYLAIFCNILQYLVIFGNIIKENLVGHILAGRKHSFFPEILFFKANFFAPSLFAWVVMCVQMKWKQQSRGVKQQQEPYFTIIYTSYYSQMQRQLAIRRCKDHTIPHQYCTTEDYNVPHLNKRGAIRRQSVCCIPYTVLPYTV